MGTNGSKGSPMKKTGRWGNTGFFAAPAVVLTVLLVVAFLMAAGGAAPLQASPTEVVKAVFRKAGGSWHVSVTLRHADASWKHYANLWVVETLDGVELGRRVLFHPHDNEQPFTRSETVRIPPGTNKVRIRAGDNVNGLNSNVVEADLTRRSGDRYEVR